MKRVVIVGGGITGLATAHALEKSREPCSVTIVEAASRFGGNLVTLSHNGFGHNWFIKQTGRSCIRFCSRLGFAAFRSRHCFGCAA